MDEDSNESEPNGPWTYDDSLSSPPSSPASNLPSSPESPTPSPSQPMPTNPVPVNPVPAAVSPGIANPLLPSIVPTIEPLSSAKSDNQSNSVVQITLPVEKLHDPAIRALLGLQPLQNNDSDITVNGVEDFEVDNRKRRRVVTPPPVVLPPIETSNRFSPLESESEIGPLKAPQISKSNKPLPNTTVSHNSPKLTPQNGPFKAQTPENPSTPPQVTRKYKIPPIFLKEQSDWSIKNRAIITATSRPPVCNTTGSQIRIQCHTYDDFRILVKSQKKNGNFIPINLLRIKKPI
ncbi:vegetative cell wall protein gp1-like [Ischnura elegans]|uniref:vegetative cell wall protein gp1-like n=1 Tax=Ischnura elegans TaxID=197161 RepID=UPI001ED88534|nr:vegetative cell wall protein gp1-like [Ischnura elegans]